ASDAMSKDDLSANRPAAVAAQSTRALDDKHRAALRAARRGRDDRAARARDEDLPLATAVPIHGDSLATQLVRELVRSFHVGGGGAAPEVARLRGGGVHPALEDRLHADVRRDVDLVGRREAPLDVAGDGGMSADSAVLGDAVEQLAGGEAALGGETLERRVHL